MKPRTQKQKDQWKRFNELGTLVGTARWVQSKIPPFVKDQTIDLNVRWELEYHSKHLQRLLIEIAKQKGWKQNPPTP